MYNFTNHGGYVIHDLYRWSTFKFVSVKPVQVDSFNKFRQVVVLRKLADLAGFNILQKGLYVLYK